MKEIGNMYDKPSMKRGFFCSNIINIVYVVSLYETNNSLELCDAVESNWLERLCECGAIWCIYNQIIHHWPIKEAKKLNIFLRHWLQYVYCVYACCNHSHSIHQTIQLLGASRILLPKLTFSVQIAFNNRFIRRCVVWACQAAQTFIRCNFQK